MLNDTDIANDAVLVENPWEIRYCEYGSKIERTDLAQMCRQTCLPQRFNIDALLSATKAKEKRHYYAQ